MIYLTNISKLKDYLMSNDLFDIHLSVLRDYLLSNDTEDIHLFEMRVTCCRIMYFTYIFLN